MALVVNLANLGQPDLLGPAQQLLREIVQADPHPVRVLYYGPHVPLVKIIRIHGHLKPHDLSHR
jgi:hypothetical protein